MTHQSKSRLLSFYRSQRPLKIESAISRVLSRTIIYLGCQLPDTSSDLPGKSASNLILPLFGLAAGGVYQAGQSPDLWCALTAPFHPYLAQRGGLFSVALSLGSPPLDVIQHPALCSSDFPQTTPFGLLPAIVVLTRSQTLIITRNNPRSMGIFPA